MPDVLDILKSLTEPALGCTEPGAVALAAAAASRAVGGRVKRLGVIVDNNVYKNSMAVKIPGFDRTGVAAAAALGAVGGNPALLLQVLRDVDAAAASEAASLVDTGAVTVTVQERAGRLYIEVRVETSSGEGLAVLDGGHTRFVRLQANGRDLDVGPAEAAATGHSAELRDVSIDRMLDMVERMTPDETDFVLAGMEMNRSVAEEGLEGRLGLGIGAAIRDQIRDGWYADDVAGWIRVYTAAGADARMAGCPKPVMNSSGSGNQGLMITLSIDTLARVKGYSADREARAIALAHMVSAKIKAHIGKLSAVCGCTVAAATGTAAGMALLLGGDLQSVESAIINMLGDITGEICDGAKEGCALKLATASAAALQAALLACRGIRIPDNNGIVGCNASETICNVGRISNPGMIDTDRVILEVMKNKAESREVRG